MTFIYDVNILSTSEMLCSGSTVKRVSRNHLNKLTLSSFVLAFSLPNFDAWFSILSLDKPRIFFILCQSFGSNEILIFKSFIPHFLYLCDN